ncbi:MAG: Pvc16 family protein [Cyanobacteria bacterium P01_F01_bin.150]
MIPAIAQTLANILVVGTSLTRLDQISLSVPDTVSELKTGLNLYFYDVRQSSIRRSSSYGRSPVSNSSATDAQTQSLVSTDRNPPDLCSGLLWFDVAFVVTAHNQTSLGMQELLSEALAALMKHSPIPEEFLEPTLQGDESLSLSLQSPSDIAGFWSALRQPLRPAIFVIVTAPFKPD